jgi:hypothetical protein
MNPSKEYHCTGPTNRIASKDSLGDYIEVGCVLRELAETKILEDLFIRSIIMR